MKPQVTTASLTVTASFMAMECAWLGVVLTEIAQARPEPFPVLWTLLLYPGVWLAGRLEPRLPIPTPAATLLRLAIGAAVVAAVAMAVAKVTPAGVVGLFSDIEFNRPAPAPLKSLIITAFASGLLVGRGYVLAGRRVDTDGFALGFQIGMAMLLGTVFLHQMIATPDRPVLIGLGIFLGVGLFGLWFTGWHEGARRNDRLGWPLLAIAAITGVLALGAGLWSFLNAETMHLLVSPMIWLWHMLVRFLAWLSSLLPTPQIPPPPPDFGVPKPPKPRSEVFLEVSEFIRWIAGIMFGVSVAVLAAMVLLRNLLDLMRWLMRIQGARGVVYEHAATGLLDDLREVLAALRDLFRRLRHRVAGWLGGRSRDLTAPEIRAVRLLYARVQKWARARGFPRQPGQTPHEYLAVLRRAFPAGGEDLILITTAYEGVRYGAVRPGPDVLEELRAAWRRVRRSSRFRRRKQETRSTSS